MLEDLVLDKAITDFLILIAVLTGIILLQRSVIYMYMHVYVYQNPDAEDVKQGRVYGTNVYQTPDEEGVRQRRARAARGFYGTNVYQTPDEEDVRQRRARAARGFYGTSEPSSRNPVCRMSPALQALLGKHSLRKTEIVEQVRAYIKHHNLLDPSDNGKIICDDALRLVFKRDSIYRVNLFGLLSKHIIQPEPTEEYKRTGTFEWAPRPVTISEALSNFLGTKEREMEHSDVLGRVFEYINVNHLADPQNGAMVICDEKLKELLGCESISILDIIVTLPRHHMLER